MIAVKAFVVAIGDVAAVVDSASQIVSKAENGKWKVGINR
jgi:hypothetical protein